MSRAGDPVFGNQIRRLLERQAREQRLKGAIARLAEKLPEAERAEVEVAAWLAEVQSSGPATVVTLGYRAGFDEAGVAAPFDFARATIEDRWKAGATGMRLALEKLRSKPAGRTRGEAFRMHEVDVPPGASLD